MKNLIQILLACTIVEGLQLARPGAQWVLRGDRYVDLEWLDTAQSKPTPSEVVTAIQTCNADQAARLSAKTQARLDVKNTSLTQAQRFQALTILLDFDR